MEKFNPDPVVDKMTFDAITANDLLLGRVDSRIRQRFINWLAGRQATKRKASEFLQGENHELQ